MRRNKGTTWRWCYRRRAAPLLPAVEDAAEGGDAAEAATEAPTEAATEAPTEVPTQGQAEASDAEVGKVE